MLWFCTRIIPCPPPMKMISVSCGISRQVIMVTLSRLTQTVCALRSLHFAHDAIVGNSLYRGMILLPSQLLGCAHGREQRDELAVLHSITSSASASSVGGIWRLSVFAVLRLMTILYRVGLIRPRPGMTASRGTSIRLGPPPCHLAARPA